MDSVSGTTTCEISRVYSWRGLKALTRERKNGTLITRGNIRMFEAPVGTKAQVMKATKFSLSKLLAEIMKLGNNCWG
jgi:hypothetical protein